MAAIGKQYELLFLLKAQMDSAFGTGFSTARNYLANLQSQVKDYNATLRDVAAYQRHEQSLNTLNTRLEAEKKALAEVEQRIQAEGRATKENAREKQTHEARIATLTAKIEEQKRKLQEEKDALEKAGVSTDHLSAEQERLKAELEKVTQEMQEWQNFTNRITDVSNALNSVTFVANSVANGVKKVNSAIMDCIDSAGELEFTMSAVAAVSGATELETESLTAMAKQMGATTIYTASQCAEALESMSLAGWSVNEMLSGMPSVVKLAAASGEDLTEMTSIVSDSLAAFGLSGEEAVTKFADVLTKTATSSNTNVSLIGESLSHVESTAANLGYSIEDVGVLLGIMANNALKGSVSGTALNTTLTRMSGANETAAKEMEALGLSMYNTDGTAKDLLTFMNELRAAFAEFGDDAQSAQIAAYKLAGQRGMRGLLSIVNTSEEEWQEMIEAVYDYAGAADTISSIRLDNYEGQIYLMESAWDALKTTVGEAFLPMATRAAELLTDMSNAANDFVGEHQELITSLSVGVTTLGAFAMALVGAGLAVNVVKTALVQLGIESAAAMGWVGLAGLLLSATAGLIAYSVQLDTASEATQRLKEESDALVDSIYSSRNAYEATAGQYESHREKALGLISILDDLIASGEDDAFTQWQIKSAVESLNELLPDLNLEYDSLTGTINTTTDAMRDMANVMGNDEAESKMKRLQEAQAEQAQIEELMAAALDAYTSAKDAYDRTSEEWAETGNVYLGSQEEWITAKDAYDELAAQYDALQAEIDSLKGELGDYSEAQEEAADATGDASAAMEAQQEALAEIEELAQEYADTWAEVYESIYNSLMSQYDLFGEAAEIEAVSLSKMQENVEAQRRQAEDYRSNLETIFGSGIDVSPMLEELTSGTTDAKALADEMSQAISSGNEQAVIDLIDQWQGLQDEVSATSSMVTDMYPEVQAAFDDLTNTIASIDNEELKSQAQAIGAGVGDGIVVGIEEKLGIVHETGIKAGEEATSGVGEGAEVASPSKATEETGEFVDQGLIDGMLALMSEVNATASSVGQGATTAFGASMSQSIFYTYGTNAIQGAINGINAKRTALVSTARAAGQAAANAYKDAQDIHSPSKLFEWFSEMDMVGAMQGIERNQDEVNATFAEAARQNAEAYRESALFAAKEGAPSGADYGAGSETFSAVSGTGLELSTEPMTAYTYETNSSRESAVIQLSYAPVITASGTEDAKSIREQLAQHDEELLEKLNDLLDERERSQARRLY